MSTTSTRITWRSRLSAQLVDPIGALTDVVAQAVDPSVRAVLLLGSLARGEATPDSDIDLAVIADPGWSGQTRLEDIVRSRLGNPCDVLLFTSAEFDQLALDGEPVVVDVARYGIALIGGRPGVRQKWLTATAQHRSTLKPSSPRLMNPS